MDDTSSEVRGDSGGSEVGARSPFIAGNGETAFRFVQVHGLRPDGSCTCGRETCASKGKHPVNVGWKDAATDDLGAVQEWLDAGYNVGCVTSASGIVVVDVDDRNDGELGLVELQTAAGHGDLPYTLEVKTGGGRHLYFSVPPGAEYRDAPGAYDGIDLKADGFVVCPPSRHWSGVQYRTIEPAAVAPAPDWLLAMVTGGPRPQVVSGAASQSILGQAFELEGWVKGESPDGEKLYMVCPWVGEHTTPDAPGGSDTVVFAGSADAKEPAGWFKCSHGHCAGRKQGEVWDTVSETLQRSVLNMMGIRAHWRPREAKLELVSGGAPAPARRPPAQTVDAPTAKWTAKLLCDRYYDAKLDSDRNVMLMLTNDQDWRGKLGMDVYKWAPCWLDEIQVGHDETIEPGPVNFDTDCQALEVMANRYRNHTPAALSQDRARRAITGVAMQSPFNPVMDYLLGLKWDGKGRLYQAHSYFRTEGDQEYESEAIRAAIFVAGVARALDPGCVAQEIAILEGEQGCGKSYACKILGGDYSGEVLKLRDKDDYIQLGRAWVNEIPELVATDRMNSEQKKAFVSCAVDTYRRPYAAMNEEVPRRFILIGTTNRDDYLEDPTGARRFLPIQCGHVNLEALKADRDQLWAEAVQLFKGGHPTMLGDLGRKAQQKIAKDRQPESSLIAALPARLVLSFEEIRSAVDRMRGWRPDKEITDILMAHGWSRARVTVRQGVRERVWKHRKATEADIAGFRTRWELTQRQP